ncbi:hypothetical protein [Leucobacter sp. 1207-22]|uniref:hypothetical protein n=1 Tax=Leucobacter sp. 1207-22 TaxID=2604456 RepID=UPI00406461D6
MWVWIIAVVVLVLGGGTAGYLVVQQSVAHETALTKHADAITAYETAWTEFERQNTDTRDDHAAMSATSLDNLEAVNDTFKAATSAADALAHIDFTKANPDTSNEQLGNDTQRIQKATHEVEQVTQQLADASAFFLDSHRQTAAQSLTTQIEKAEQVLDASRENGDAELVTQLEQAISNAQTLTEDPKAHPTDLRHTMEGLVTLTGQVKDSVGPRPDSVTGDWVMHLSTGGNRLEMTSSSYSYDSGRKAGSIEFIDTPTADQFGSRIIDSNTDCFFFTDKGAADPRRNFFVYCPIGAGNEPQSDLVPGSDVERLDWYDGHQVTTFVRG